MQVKFTTSARKHRIGRAHALYVMDTTEPKIIPATQETKERQAWIGLDDRGLELEITAVVLPDCLLVIHVMPTHYRKKNR